MSSAAVVGGGDAVPFFVSNESDRIPILTPPPSTPYVVRARAAFSCVSPSDTIPDGHAARRRPLASPAPTRPTSGRRTALTASTPSMAATASRSAGATAAVTMP